jgi:hypothetical protein
MEKHVAVASGSDKEPPDLTDHVSRLPSRLGPGMGISHGINAYIERSGMARKMRASFFMVLPNQEGSGRIKARLPVRMH